MTSALQFIERTLIDELFNAPPAHSGYEKTGQFLCTIFSALVVIGLIFSIYGAHAWLSLQYRADIAALITGALILALCATTAIALFIVACYQKSRIKKYRKKITDKIKLFLLTLEDEFGEPIRKNPKTAVIIAALLGFLFEDQLFQQHKKM